MHPGKEGAAARRSLSVRYAPLYDNDSLERILVIISDITEVIALRQDVENAREQSNMRLQIVAEMLAADRSSLSSFFEEIESRAATIRGVLAEVERAAENKDSLALLFREIHTLKGNSRMLKFGRLARESHEFEDVHAELIQNRQLSRRVQGPLRDALTHLVRNALDHGIEAPEQRGDKAQEASLTLGVGVSTAGRLELQLADDGRGINHDLVFQIAKKKGLVPLDKVQPAPEEVYELLFAPGFSTKNEASDISGRGVGLDAVRSGLQDYGGEVFVTSQKGRGTIFHILLPAEEVFVACKDSRILPLQPSQAFGVAS